MDLTPFKKRLETKDRYNDPVLFEMSVLVDEVERLQRVERICHHYERWLRRIEAGDNAPRSCAAHALDGAMGIP